MKRKQIQEDIKNKLPEKIAGIISLMCGYDCERKKDLTKSITAGYMERIANIKTAQHKLGNIVKGKYMEIVGNLRLDLRIFLGSNAIMFLVLLLLSFSKPKAIPHLFVPGVLLLVSTIVSSGIYIYGQDWFYTILYNNYMGFWYLAYISVIFGFLIDVALNKARVTTKVINVSFHGLTSVVPC